MPRRTAPIRIPPPRDPFYPDPHSPAAQVDFPRRPSYSSLSSTSTSPDSRAREEARRNERHYNNNNGPPSTDSSSSSSGLIFDNFEPHFDPPTNPRILLARAQQRNQMIHDEANQMGGLTAMAEELSMNEPRRRQETEMGWMAECEGRERSEVGQRGRMGLATRALGNLYPPPRESGRGNGDIPYSHGSDDESSGSSYEPGISDMDSQGRMRRVTSPGAHPWSYSSLDGYDDGYNDDEEERHYTYGSSTPRGYGAQFADWARRNGRYGYDYDGPDTPRGYGRRGM